MDLCGKRIILGSASPRRKELLAGLDVEFEVDTLNNYVEDFGGIGSAREIPSMMSKGKSHGFHRALEADEILITADTMVLCGEQPLGKPHDREEAFKMLSSLSGREHEVITAVTMRSESRETTFEDVAKVSFLPLADEEINYYIDRYKPFDKAGAYGIQEWIGYVGIDRIEGSFYTIMGFPVHKVYAAIKDLSAPCGAV